ncbi:DUF1848 domain-containing protein [Caenispirillum bisanense]|uniref:DUF1848 domain-containing protein n=1 Tax=Caenispirillum bisanense TaxID=414052 RepID=UPI0031DECBD8
MIISASRRTDIPAFYTDWFMNRLAAGYLMIRSPWNYRSIQRVSLHLDDVDAIVFWTRNPRQLLPRLAEIDSYGYRYYFQYTITGYGRKIEPSVPTADQAVETFKKLSDLIGPERVIWRYDPILVSNLCDISAHKRQFDTLSRSLSGYTRRVVISFVDLYKGTERNLKKIDGLNYHDIVETEWHAAELCAFMKSISVSRDMEIQTCAEKIDLSGIGISHGKCIDDDLLKRACGVIVSSEKDSGQREECGCVKSIDIGTYNSCLHGCAYCYATPTPTKAKNGYQAHDPESPLLIGKPDDQDIASLESKMRQRQLPI